MAGLMGQCDSAGAQPSREHQFASTTLTIGQIGEHTLNTAGGVTINSSTLTTATAVLGIPIHGYNFAPITSTSSSSPPTSTSTPTSIASPQNPSAHTGLSTGAKIGLGLGIPAVAILAALASFYIFHVRRNTRASTIPSEISAGSTTQKHKNHELLSTQAHEMFQDHRAEPEARHLGEL
ncbi:hypothetical protein V2W45_1452867 [Cenococcum geophilum]